MKFAVDGGGNAGQEISVYLALNDNEVKSYTSNSDRTQVTNDVR